MSDITTRRPQPTTTDVLDDVTAATMTPLTRRILAVTRIALGWVFLWTFLDKTFGLGYSTSSDEAWLSGGSPTSGYLSSRDGTFSDLFTSMSGQAWADWMFMGGMAGLGIALALGIGLRLAAAGGVILLGMLYMSSLPLDTNPFLDMHLVYAISIIALAAARAGDTWGLGGIWANTAPVRNWPILR